MKYLCCVALLLGGLAQAGELLPTQGERSTHMQSQLDATLRPVVERLPPSVSVEPTVVSIRLAGRAKRILLGPLARPSHVTLRVRVVAAGKTTDEVFHREAGAWRGTFRPGQDYEMLKLVAEDAAAFVSRYGAAE